MSLSYFEQRTCDTGAKYGISLAIFRPAVDDLLRAIPSSGFFRTYTDHSLRHCDEMFTILGWLLPQSVQEGLADIECTLLVLAVYLHDLGMLATQDEFMERQSNADFVRYQDRYTQAFDCTSSLDADHPSLDHFIFEEYIRHTHAQRIFEWLSSEEPKEQELPPAKILRGLLSQTSPNFRFHLGVICKSHHLNNLHDKSQYPVDCHFGNNPTDRANIQFIAVCLRLADILHMSRDRTPSIQFQLISPRNPIGAREWAKQLDVSGTGPSRTDPTEICVDAVCNNPRMYFYLKDFIRVSDEELLRCRGWLEANPSAITKRYFLTAKHVSDAGLRAHGFIADRFELQLDQRRIIDLLMGHSLYGDSKVAIRELVQNSLDAVRVRRLEDAALKPAIVIHLNEERSLLEITDNGIGMDLEVIRSHFLNVGDSYYRSAAFRRRCPGYIPISQFGIGFLSSFMIADHVTVVTRTTEADSATLVVDLEDIYDLFAVREISRYGKEGLSVAEGGTSVILHLRKGVELGDVVEDVRRWLVFLEFPITVKVGNDAPKEVWGIKGTTPSEIANDIARRVDEDATDYFPIEIKRDSVEIVILWPGGKLGDVPVLDPAGRYLLPLTMRVRQWNYDDGRQLKRRAQQNLVRKVANGGIFLASELPGLKIAERLRIHYVVDCRGELRFTPLVSRDGIAIDDSSIAILELFIDGLTRFLSENLSKLLESGVSKYFCSYYVASALQLLFRRQEIEKEEERVLSAIMAIRHAYGVPFLLFKHNAELVLRSWADHRNQAIVFGHNVYASLLRSVAFGLVDFPLPKEVVDSLPENFLLAMGAEDVIYPMVIISEYKPSAVLYHEPSRGVFVKWEMKAETTRFGGTWLLNFPTELNDVAGIQFELGSCLNANHPSSKRVIEFAHQVISRLTEAKQDEIERACAEILLDRHRHLEMREGDTREHRRFLRERFSKIGEAAVDVSSEMIDLCISAHVIRADLWSLRD